MRTDQQVTEPISQYLHSLYGGEPSDVWKRSREFAGEFKKEHISLGPLEGRILGLLVATAQVQNFVEIGTLTGTSALWILWGMSQSEKVRTSVSDRPMQFKTIEKDLQHSIRAQEILTEWKRSTNSSIEISVEQGDAESILAGLAGPFDGCFIDANKGAYLTYLKWAEKNIRPGGILIADNVFLRGAVTGAYGEVNAGPFGKKQVQVMQEFNVQVGEKFEAVILPTKEGLMFALRKDN